MDLLVVGLYTLVVGAVGVAIGKQLEHRRHAEEREAHYSREQLRTRALQELVRQTGASR